MNGELTYLILKSFMTGKGSCEKFTEIEGLKQISFLWCKKARITRVLKMIS